MNTKEKEIEKEKEKRERIANFNIFFNNLALIFILFCRCEHSWRNLLVWL